MPPRRVSDDSDEEWETEKRKEKKDEEDVLQFALKRLKVSSKTIRRKEWRTLSDYLDDERHVLSAEHDRAVGMGARGRPT